MTATINASTTAGVVTTADTSGILQLQTNGTAALTIDASQNTTLAGTLTSTGVTTFAAGTAALPAITTTGDTNTGIFFPAADTVGVATGGSERVRVNSSGNVGIGTSSPSSKLDVQVTSATAYSSGVTGNGLRLFNSSATTGQYVGITFNGEPTSGNGGLATIMGTTTGSGNMDLTFSTRGSSTLAERMRITSAGDFMVGKTSMGVGTQGFGVYSTGDIEVNAGSNPAAYFNRTNDGTIIQFRRSGTTVGTISVTTSATAYNTSSDYRLKEAIAPMTGALAKVALLKPVTYKWKIDGSDGQGFIAHELDEVVKGCVTGEKDAVDADGKPQYQGIDTSFLVATLTAAIQELKAIVDAQGAEIAALKGATA